MYNLIKRLFIICCLISIATAGNAKQEAAKTAGNDKEAAVPWVPWKTFEQVTYGDPDKQTDPKFAEKLQALAGKEVQVEGYMIPLDVSHAQKNFLISAYPVINCYFCGPGGPKGPYQVVEIQAQQPLEYRKAAVMLQGKLELLNDDPMGLLYRLTNATLVR